MPAGQPIRFAVALANQHIAWEDYLTAVKAADEMAFECFWTFDHLYPIGGDLDDSCFESYTTMAAFAQATKRIRIGALVTGATYRNAALQIKMATQIDVIQAERDLFSAEVNQIQARTELASSRVSLRLSAGLPLQL